MNNVIDTDVVLKLYSTHEIHFTHKDNQWKSCGKRSGSYIITQLCSTFLKVKTETINKVLIN